MTITDYDSNATALAKVKAGGKGFDMVVPSANYVKIFIELEGLALEVRPDQMENFKYVAPEWRNPAWDPGRRYSVPWQWGTVGMLDPESPVIQYVPEVADSAYGDCTVRHVLDMTVSSSFSEEYLDLSGDYGRYRRATLWDPTLPGEDPGTLHGLLATLSPAPEPHGEIFNLCNLIWIIKKLGNRYYLNC